MGSDPHLCMSANLSRLSVQRSDFGILTMMGVVVFLSLPNTCPALGSENQQAAEEQFIDGLLTRRLFPLAVVACEERLAGNALSPLERANTLVDLSRTYATWAKQCSPQSSVAHWTQAELVLENWLKENMGNLFEPIISRQRAQVALQRGEFIRQISAGAVDPAPTRAESLLYLRQATSIGEKTLKKIDKALLPPIDSRLPSGALISIQTALEKDLSQAWMEQARCHEAGSPDRIHALQQAQQLISPLAVKNDPIDWESRIARLTCLRLLGGKKNERLFQQQASADLSENPPIDVQGRIRLELARQLSDKADYLKALETLNQPLNYSPEIEAEVDFCELQIMLKAAASKKVSDAANWNQRAENQLELIENLHDPYWLQRARALFGRQMTIDPSQHGYPLLVRAAEGLYQAGQLADAVRVYEEAARKADEQGDSARAFELARAAAMIDYENKKYREASDKLRRLSITYSRESGAAAAHLMAAYNLALALKGSPPDAFSRYQQLLEEHLERWPTHASSNQARLWLGRMLAATKQWAAASQILFEVAPSSSVYPEAIQIGGVCCVQECAAMATKNGSQLTVRADVLSQRMRAASERLIDANSPVAGAAIADTATLQMHYTSNPYRGLLELIEQGLIRVTKSDQKNHDRLQALQIEALVGLGQYEEALNVLKTFEGDTADIVQLILSLQEIQNRLREENNLNESLRALAKVELACFQKLGDFSALPEKKRLAVIRAQAFIGLGKTTEALTLLRKLAVEYSSDGKIQLRYADLLIEQSNASSRREALKKYREITRRARPQSEQWFAAKYGEARARLLLGNTLKAAQTIRTTQVLFPDLGGDRWRQRFEKLLAACAESDGEPHPSP